MLRGTKRLTGVTGISLGLLLSLVGCAGTSARVPMNTTAEIKEEQTKQKELSDAAGARAEARKQERIAKQTERLHYVFEQLSESSQDICGEFESDTCSFQVELDSETGGVNAFADGNKIIVTSGMMNFAKKDDELALVIGHEMAHNIMGHPGATRRNVYAGAIAGSVVDLLAASQGMSTDMAFAKTGGEMGKLSYSADYESEADYVGLYITARAGYGIGKSKDFWRKMAIKNPNAIFISTTHPTSAERYVSLEKTAQEIGHKREEAMRLLPEKASHSFASGN